MSVAKRFLGVAVVMALPVYAAAGSYTTNFERFTSHLSMSGWMV